MLKTMTTDWKERVRPILQLYVDRLPGALLEEKEFSLAWHYRRADPEQASLRAKELLDDLAGYTRNIDVQVFEGNKVIEIRNTGVNKGTAAMEWLTSHTPDFILGIGDDWTDEDLFRALPPTAFSVRVGPGEHGGALLSERPRRRAADAARIVRSAGTATIPRQRTQHEDALIGKRFLDAIACEPDCADFKRAWNGIFGARTLIVSGFGPMTCGSTWRVTVLFASLLVFDCCTALAAAFLRRTRTRQARADAKELKHHVFGALGKPLYLLIWIYGIYLASHAAAVEIAGGRGIARLSAGFSTSCSTSACLRFCSGCFSGSRTCLEARLAAWAAKTESKLDDLFVPLVGKSLRVIVPVVGIIFALPVLDLPPEYAGILAKGTSILLIVAVAFILFQAVNLGEKAVLTEYDITCAGQSSGPQNLHPGPCHQQNALRHHRSVHGGLDPDAVRGSAAVRHQHSRLGGRRRRHPRLRRAKNHCQFLRRFSTRHDPADPAGRRRHRRRRMGPRRGNHPDLRGHPHLGRPPARRAVELFHRKAVPELDAASRRELLGSVFVWVDYSLPLDEPRKALKEIIENHPLWDKRFWNLQVTDATEKTMQIRVLATAADSSKSWDLRCDIREKLIAYIQKNHPQSLPRCERS